MILISLHEGVLISHCYFKTSFTSLVELYMCILYSSIPYKIGFHPTMIRNRHFGLFFVTEIEARRNGDNHNDTVSYEVKIGGWRCTDYTSSYKTSQKSSLRKQNLGLNTCKKVEEIKDIPRCLIY